MTTSSKRLLVRGRIDRVGGEVARGMPVLAQDGSMVGAVAAVVQSDPTRTTHASAVGTSAANGRLPPHTPGFAGSPGRRIASGCCATRQQIAALPSHQPDD
jgi:hypothetical protein